MIFSLSAEEITRVETWSKDQDKLVSKIQGTAEPYYGAIGGELTYSFTPTSLGNIVKVQHGITENILDLTDYDSW